MSIPKDAQYLRLFPCYGDVEELKCRVCDVPCRDDAGREIIAGHNGDSNGIRLCNLCLTKLRELIVEYENAPTKVPIRCTACGHEKRHHYTNPGPFNCAACACPGYAGPQ